jgi:Domain of unknown function (DUF4062)
MDKRYQVFVSSTYADLKDERRAVIQTLIQLGCIPAGMELFPAADQEQLEFIKRVIDDCDYYLLIIAGRYGSVSASGLSYTEQEYDYAVQRGLKVMAFVHENPEVIQFGKSEKDPASREKLEQFRKKVRTGRLVKSWNSPSDLPSLVALSLPQFIHAHPAVGWIKADKPNEDAIMQIAMLQGENLALKQQLADAYARIPPPVALPNLAGLDEEIAVGGYYYRSGRHGQQRWSKKTSWREIFGLISPYLIQLPNHEYVKDVLLRALFDEMNNHEVSSPNLDDQVFRTIGVQLSALGLVNLQRSSTTSGPMAVFWSATPAGERLMLELRAVRSKAPTGPPQ